MPRKNRADGPRISVFILAMALHAFGLDCMIANSFDRAFSDKRMYASSRASPHLSNRDTVYAGLPWNITILFKEYTRDYFGKTDVSFSCKILKPDGRLFFDTTGIHTVSGLMTNDTGPLLSSRIPAILFSRKDTPGRYTVIVTAKDGITKVKKTKEKAVFLSDYPKTTSHTFDDISFNVWIHSYCLDPDPGRAISAFSYFIGSTMSDNNDIFWPVFYFFQCLFSDNPALMQKLAGAIPKSSPRLRDYTVFLLRAIRIKKSDVNYPIPDSLWKKFDKAAATGFRDPFTDAFTIGSNRLIEFGFYYYGKYSMVRFLIECLGLTTPAGYDAFLNNCKVYTEDCPESLDQKTALQFYTDAGKILEKLYAKHPLVNAYCNYAFEKDHFEAGAVKTLKKIIDAAGKQTPGRQQ